MLHQSHDETKEEDANDIKRGGGRGGGGVRRHGAGVGDRDDSVVSNRYLAFTQIYDKYSIGR